LVLANGGYQFMGDSAAAIENYLQSGNTELEQHWAWKDAPGAAEARLTAISVAAGSEVLYIDEPLTLFFEAMLSEEVKLPAEFNFSLVLGTVEEAVVFNVGSEAQQVEKRCLRASCTIPAHLLNDETYTVRILLVKDRSVPLFDVHHVMTFKMQERDRDSNWHGKWIGVTRPQQLVSWTIEA
jgi:lipopolysaccharide transport system ATP-binding protein